MDSGLERLTIVIAGTSAEALNTCLQSVAREVPTLETQLIVVHSGQPEIAQLVSSFGLAIEQIECPAKESIFGMRRAGMHSAKGDLIACLGERYIVRSSWIESVWSAKNWDILTGFVAPAQDLTAVGWSIYLAEYASLLASHTDVKVADTPGGNVVYRREHLQDVQEKSEFALHSRLGQSGCRFRTTHGMTVEFASPPSFGGYLMERYRQSAAWGTDRASQVSAIGRGMLATSRLALPGLLLVRRARFVRAAGLYRFRFVRSVPLIAFYVIVEMFAEIIGLLKGSTRD